MQVTLYGIPNCDTVRKARDWLREQGIAFAFHDFKKMGLQRATVQGWLQQLPRDALLNRKGTTWRGLDQAQKDGTTDDASAIELMLASPSLVKRPVLAHGVRLAAGFSAAGWHAMFSDRIGARAPAGASQDQP